MFVLKKSIFAIFYTIQTKQTRIYHQKNQKTAGQESIYHTKYSIKDRHGTKNQNICNANLFAHEKTYIKKGKININFQKYKNQPHQD
ncbi:polysaccharide deacetylase [Salmonella enterica]|nr:MULTISPECIES: polysaccharide deacetylase [Salmonella]HDW4221075.1 polysaccharide deacetylase [Salmonella enterica subsp. enterica serovar Typhi]EDN6404342.1 polysaccharide deacetylase [Salmonella enterica]EDO3380906.1 polysaccharide deacetylase [Salmonella enterica subsp. enterica serovar Enteritidis]EDZ3219462.1 polysaccharide deacetylase [Salmonella enterica]EDZ4848048.1 polysaccharide deacetylase [Salmonella enterica]